MQDIARSLRDLERREWETADDPEPLRMALIGLGEFTRNVVVPRVRDAEHATVAVLVSGSQSKARRVCESAGADRALTYEAFHDGEAADAYDAVYVCTPNALHRPFVETAADLGKAVLCEKPMAATLEGAEAIVETCESADVPLMVAYRVQTNPVVRRLREAILEGTIGEPIVVEGSMTQDVFESISPDLDQWRLDPELAGGAALNDLGIYPLNTARFLLDADPTAVRGTTRSDDPAFDGVDEHVTFEVEFDDGTLGSFYASQHADVGSRFTVVGREGRVTLDPAFFGRVTVEVSTPAGDVTADPDRSVTGSEITEEFDYFADRVRSGAPIHPDGRHGLVDMRTIDAAYRSASTGCRIELDEAGSDSR